MAAIDWDAVHTADLAASTSEEQILHLASELAGHDTSRPLAELLAGLDDTNLGRLLRAVTCAAGHPVSRMDDLLRPVS